MATLGGYLKCTTAARISPAIHRTFFRRKEYATRNALNTAFIAEHKVQNSINVAIKVSDVAMHAKKVSKSETDVGVRV